MTAGKRRLTIKGRDSTDGGAQPADAGDGTRQQSNTQEILKQGTMRTTIKRKVRVQSVQGHSCRTVATSRISGPLLAHPRWGNGTEKNAVIMKGKPSQQQPPKQQQAPSGSFGQLSSFFSFGGV
jgi:hypothetical protein